MIGISAIYADLPNPTFDDYIAYSAPLDDLSSGVGLWIVNSANPQEKFIITACQIVCESLTWSKDRQQIAYLDGDHLRVIALDGTIIHDVVIDRGTYPYNVRPVWDDDLTQSIFTARYHARNHFVRVDMITGEQHLIGAGGEHLVWLDGAIGYASLGKIRTLDLTTGTITTLTPPNDYHDMPMWSPDKSKIAFRVWIGGSQYALAVMDADGKNGHILLDGIIERPQWSHDGRYLGTIQWNNLQGSQSTLVIMDTSDDSYHFLTPRVNVSGLHVVWGDRQLAFVRQIAGDQHQLVVYDLVTGVENIVIDDLGERPQQIAWK